MLSVQDRLLKICASKACQLRRKAPNDALRTVLDCIVYIYLYFMVVCHHWIFIILVFSKLFLQGNLGSQVVWYY